MSKTLDDLRENAKSRADMVGRDFVSNAEWNIFINGSLGTLYDILIENYGTENFLDGYEFATTADQARYDLPVNIQKFAGLDLSYNSKWYTLDTFTHEDRLVYLNATDHIVNGIPRYKYRLRDGHLVIYPVPERTYNCVMHYLPRVTELSNSSDTVDSSIVESWLEFVWLDAAIKALKKQENDVTALEQEKQFLIQRIQFASKERNISKPDPTQDTAATLYNLRIQTRYRANILGTEVVTDKELNHYINNSLGELHDLVVGAYEDYAVDGYQFTTVSGQQDYTLPTDFYKLGGAELISGSTKIDLMRVNFGERNYYENSLALNNYNGVQYFYRVIDDFIRIMPTPSAGETIQIWYTKQFTRLTSDTDTVKDTTIISHLEYVIIDAAIKCLQKLSLLKNEPQIKEALMGLYAQKQSMKDRIEKIIQVRNWGEPSTVTDVYKKGGWPYVTWL